MNRSSLLKSKCLALLLLAVHCVAGVSVRADDEQRVVNLKMDPAGEPVPALKYQFTPRYLEQIPGDAAQFYYRAVLMKQSMPKEIEQQLADNPDWYDKPLDAQSRKEIRVWVGRHERIIGELRRAFLRTQCTWDLGARKLKGNEAIALLLPEAQQLRSIARMLSLKAKLEIDQRRYDDALETLSLGYKMARDEARQPTLINSLIGVAIVGTLNEQLERLLASPGAPNMYWAIASLPRPVIDMGQALRQELAFPAQLFPGLRDPQSAEHSIEGWRKLWTTVGRELVALGDGGFSFGGDGWQLDAGITLLMLKAYPQAKRDLVEAGYDRAKLETMPVGQVVAIHQRRLYEIGFHQMFKWSLLPTRESVGRLERVQADLMRMGYLRSGGGKEVFPIVSLLLPALDAAVNARLRADRQLAALRAVEAIRMYASSHDGRLPQSLDRIKQVPVPNDPLTGAPFPYQLDGKTATLQIPPPPGRQGRRESKVYRLSIRNQ